MPHVAHRRSRTWCSPACHQPKYWVVFLIDRYVLLDNGEALVIDVRTERELLEDGVIQGALNIPLKQLKVNHSV